MTRSFDKRDSKPDCLGVALGVDEDAVGSDGVKGCGDELPELALAANQADRVVWSTGHWSADPAGCCGTAGGAVEDEAAALSLDEVNGHISG